MDRTHTKKLWRNLLDQMRKEGLLQAQGVEAAFASVPRHLFLPGMSLEEVYSDRAIGIKNDTDGLLISSSSQPTMMAIMLNQMGLQAGANVLEIGTATGYNAAIMAHMVGKTGSVTTIELERDLAEQAARNLQNAQASSVKVVYGDGAQGYAPRAAYDHIIATVGVWDIPRAWLTQLKPTGSLVVPIVIDGIQVSAVFKPQPDGTFLSTDNRPCSFVYLRGQFAGPDFRRQVASSSLYILADDVRQIDTVALHLLLSDDHEICHLDAPLTAYDFWYGYQVYLMLNEPKNYIFVVYSVIEGRQAYGLEGRGIGLFTRGSASFLAYHEKGASHCFAGSDAFLELQDALDAWQALGRPQTEDLRLRLIPKDSEPPTITTGKLYERHDNYLHVWLET